MKPAVGVAGTRMSVVLALLAMEVGAAVVAAAAVLGVKTLCEGQLPSNNSPRLRIFLIRTDRPA